MVYKTKIKRYGLFVNVILIAFFAMTAAVTLASAYGAACVVWDPARYNSSVYVKPFLLLFQASNVFSWIVGFLWGGIIYMYLTARKGTYLLAVITSALGFIFGVLPAWIFDTTNMMASMAAGKWVSEPFTGIGSPNWGRALLNLLVLVILIVFYVYPGTKRQIKSFLSKENRIARAVPTQLIYMSMFFFWMGLFSLLSTTFMKDMHVVAGVNIWEFLEFQLLLGYFITAVGGTMLTSGLIVHFVHNRTPSLIEISE